MNISGLKRLPHQYANIRYCFSVAKHCVYVTHLIKIPCLYSTVFRTTKQLVAADPKT